MGGQEVQEFGYIWASWVCYIEHWLGSWVIIDLLIGGWICICYFVVYADGVLFYYGCIMIDLRWALASSSNKWTNYLYWCQDDLHEQQTSLVCLSHLLDLSHATDCD